jgi:uncharacterized phage protein gp47/JayE
MPADFPSRLDLFALGRDYILSRVTRIDPAQVDLAGSDVNIVVASASEIGYELVLQLAARINSLLLDGADGEDLDRYALDRYQLTRKGASAAVGSVEFTRTTTTAGAGSVPIGTKLITLTGVEYITITTATFAAAATSAFADVRAVTAGKTTQVGSNAIRRIDQPALLWDPSLAVNNADPTAGGEDAETDDVFRERIRDFFNTARRGTLDAIAFGARQVEGVESAQAVEALTLGISGSQPARVVLLYVADSSGVASAALGNVVRNALDEYRAAGIAVLVSTSVPQIVDIKLALNFRAGVDTALLSDNVRAAVVEFVNSLDVNGTLYRAQLFSVLQRFASDGLIPTETSIVEPVGDLIPDTGKTLRTTITNVTLV